MKTIKLIDQLRASAAIYARELERYDELRDEDLARVLALASTERPAPDFYASNANAIADIKRCAALETAP